jgi:hypothetical protein
MMLKENPVAISKIKTTSGATIHVTDNGVIKSGDPNSDVGKRIILQGRFCASYDVPILPKIISVNEAMGSYSMERLIPIPWNIIDHKLLFMQIVEDLFEWFWTYDHGLTIDNTGWEENHWEYIDKKIRENCGEVWRKMEMKFSALDHKELRPALIHGDPTFDNCMMRADGRIVITDPIPANFVIPNLVAVDMGKVLQSAAGYEVIKYGRPMIHLSFAEALRTMALDDLERAGAIYFCAAHFVRLLPYQKDPEHKQKFIRILNSILEF